MYLSIYRSGGSIYRSFCLSTCLCGYLLAIYLSNYSAFLLCIWFYLSISPSIYVFVYLFAHYLVDLSTFRSIYLFTDEDEVDDVDDDDDHDLHEDDGCGGGSGGTDDDGNGKMALIVMMTVQNGSLARSIAGPGQSASQSCFRQPDKARLIPNVTDQRDLHFWNGHSLGIF